MKKILCLLFTLVFLAACDDSGTSADDASKGKAAASDLRVESLGMLPNCTATYEGEVALVTDLYNTYKCENGEWKMLMESTVQTLDDLSNCVFDLYAIADKVVFVNVESEGAIYFCKEKKWTKVMDKDFTPNLSSLEDSRDGQTYKTVTIGSQTWMAQNLNFETDSSFCYKNEDANCTKYGRLYRWAAAVGKSESECGGMQKCSLPSGNIQGVCPNGWHLPSKAEWYALFDAVGGRSMAGVMLKSSSGWDGFDSFWFSALPAGSRQSEGRYYSEGNRAYFWSSTENEFYSAFSIDLIYDYDGAYLNNYDKSYGYSVRCLKD